MRLWLLDSSKLTEQALQTAADAVLSRDEQAKAASFRHAGRRQEYLAARLLCRQLLASSLQVPATSLRFQQNQHGAPSLVGQSAAGWRFSVSHSGSLIAVAVSQVARLGLDLETQRRPRNLRRLAEYAFSRKEVAAMLALPPARQAARFYLLWTAKEAVLKALGEGIAHGLRYPQIQLPPEMPGMLLARRHRPQGPWCLRSWALPGSGRMTLAVAGVAGPCPQPNWWLPGEPLQVLDAEQDWCLRQA